ncbi:myb/SANT-like DNA-binding domain-containing protein 1 [Engraulis encrasicolus]|uniref:myb/SANT-like DNA-binding domain-containing protein 1 n=1 Tax=Engraulis encrasicolus TaxID=184585 RepID=UPI002FD14326
MASDDGTTYTYVVPEKHRRARNWTDSEMKGLMYVWEEYYVPLKCATRNAKIYEKMATRLYQITGEHRHREEIKMKLTNMTFQYRKLKQTTNGVGSADWPYYSTIDNILSKPCPPPGSKDDSDLAGTSMMMGGASADLSLGPIEHDDDGVSVTMTGFIPEYTGSCDEKDLKVEELSDSSVSVLSGDSRSNAYPASKRRRMVHPTATSMPPHSSSSASSSSSSALKKRKLQVMEAMLQEQKKMRRAVEETCREVQRVVQQQSLMQMQNQKLQERMMNLLEKMVLAKESPKP